MALFSRQTLGNFIVGRENRAAHLAALEAGRNPGRRYNPLFIYGAAGHGKSHLLNAIAGEITDNDRSLSVYVDSYSAFSTFMKDSVGAGKGPSLDEYLSSVDALLLDDLASDDMWLRFQKGMLHWLDRFIRSDKQVVFTADRPLLRLIPLDGRFLSMIQRGLTVPLGVPGRRVREGIISLLVEREGLEIDDDSLSCLGGLPVSNVRELEGILNRIVLTRRAEGVELTRSWLERMLREMTDRGEIRRLDISWPEETPSLEVEPSEPVTARPGERVAVETEELSVETVADSAIEEEIEKELGSEALEELNMESLDEMEALEELEKEALEELEREALRDLGMSAEEATAVDAAKAGSGPEGDGGRGEVSEVEDKESEGPDESEGLIMEWDREEDRLLNEL